MTDVLETEWTRADECYEQVAYYSATFVLSLCTNISIFIMVKVWKFLLVKSYLSSLVKSRHFVWQIDGHSTSIFVKVWSLGYLSTKWGLGKRLGNWYKTFVSVVIIIRIWDWKRGFLLQ